MGPVLGQRLAWIKTYLHLKEGRSKGRPPADLFQEFHFGLGHRLVLVFVTFQKETLMEERDPEDLVLLRTGNGHPGALRLWPEQYPPIWQGVRGTGQGRERPGAGQPTSQANQPAHPLRPR